MDTETKVTYHVQELCSMSRPNTHAVIQRQKYAKRADGTWRLCSMSDASNVGLIADVQAAFDKNFS